MFIQSLGTFGSSFFCYRTFSLGSNYVCIVVGSLMRELARGVVVSLEWGLYRRVFPRERANLTVLEREGPRERP